jgi:acetyltransferase
VKNESEQDNVIASARYVIQSDTCCEFALAVTDSWKHHGVGHQLINALIESAKCRGIKEMYGKILCSNLEMIEFVRGCGFEVSDSNKGSWLKIATLSF